jgi:hypothetical protein
MHAVTAVADPQVSADALDDEQQRTDTWTKLRDQTRKTGTIPRGTYDAKLREVQIIRRRDGGGYALRMIALTDNLKRYVMAWRGLSESPDDPYDLTEAQVKGLRRFAEQMGIPVPAPAHAIVEALGQMVHDETSVIVKVQQNAVGQVCTITRDIDRSIRLVASTSGVVVNGQVVDGNGQVLDAEGKTRDAYEAHSKLLKGLEAVKMGLAHAAEGCHTLHRSEGWTALGYESLNEYLAAPEITISRTEFYRLTEVWQRYVVDGGLDPERLYGAAPTKLEVPFPALAAGLVSAEEAAADAEALPRKDLRDKYKDLNAGGSPDDTGQGDEQQGEGESRRRDEKPDEPETTRQRELGDDREFDPVELVGWAEKYGHPEGWAKKAQDLNGEVERLKRQLEQIHRQEEAVAAVEATRQTAAPQIDLSQQALAQGLATVLSRVMREVGQPKQKRMSGALREVVTVALREAAEQGLDVDWGE